MAPRGTYPLVDRLLDGTLAARLRTQRAEGLSYDEIAARLRDDGVVAVSGETVRQWCLALEPEQAAAQ